MPRRQTFVVKYELDGVRLQKKVIALTEWGAIIVIKALYTSRGGTLKMNSVVRTGQYYGPHIEPDEEEPGSF